MQNRGVSFVHFIYTTDLSAVSCEAEHHLETTQTHWLLCRWVHRIHCSKTQYIGKGWCWGERERESMLCPIVIQYAGLWRVLVMDKGHGIIKTQVNPIHDCYFEHLKHCSATFQMGVHFRLHSNSMPHSPKHIFTHCVCSYTRHNELNRGCDGSKKVCELYNEIWMNNTGSRQRTWHCKTQTCNFVWLASTSSTDQGHTHLHSQTQLTAQSKLISGVHCVSSRPQVVWFLVSR